MKDAKKTTSRKLNQAKRRNAISKTRQSSKIHNALEERKIWMEATYRAMIGQQRYLNNLHSRAPFVSASRLPKPQPWNCTFLWIAFGFAFLLLMFYAWRGGAN